MVALCFNGVKWVKARLEKVKERIKGKKKLGEQVQTFDQEELLNLKNQVMGRSNQSLRSQQGILCTLGTECRIWER